MPYACSRVLVRNSKDFTVFVCRRYSTSRKEDDIIAYVGASAIAQLIGANPHWSVAKAMGELWEKNHRMEYRQALERNKLTISTPEETLEDLGILEMANALVHVEDVAEYRKSMKGLLERAPTTDDKSVVKNFVNTSRGIKRENRIFEDLKAQRPSEKFATDRKRYSKLVEIPHSEVKYRISGHIDGVQEDARRIIEIKSRQTRFFNRVPLYEQIQCQAYLFLTGFDVCEHVESLNGALQSTVLDFEPVFWDRILKRLSFVLLAYDHLIRDVGAQDTFLKTGEVLLPRIKQRERRGPDEANRISEVEYAKA